MFLNIVSIFNFVFIFLFTSPGLIYFGLLNLLGYLIGSKPLQHYSYRNMIAPDQWWNAALRGEEDETVSSRLGRALISGRPKWAARLMAVTINFVFLLVAGQKNHCIESIEKRYISGAPSDEKWTFIRPE